MNSRYKHFEYKLIPQDIDRAIEQIVDFLNGRKTDSKDIIKIRLGIEESLLRYREFFGEEKSFLLKFYDVFGRIRVSVSVEGSMLDPFAVNDSPEQNSAFMRSALSNIGARPVWKYAHGTNDVSYAINKKPMSSWAQLLIALILAVVVGLGLRLLTPDTVNALHSGLITPLLNTFMNLLSAIAGPMIFLAVVWGVYSIGDVSAFSVLGSKLLLRFLIFISVLTIVIGLASLPVFNLVGGTSYIGTEFSEILTMLLNIIPGNIILPFAEGNTLQILFIGIVMGIAMIIIGEKVQSIAIFAEQLNYIVQFIMEFVSKLVPFFVFCSLLDIILNNQIEDIKVSYKLFAVNAIGCLVLVMVYVIIISIRMKVNPLKFLKKAAPTLLICLTTASSAAAFSTSLDTCKKEYGIHDSFANFGLPFSQVIYKPSVAVLYFSSAVFAAEVYGTSVSTVWIVTAFIMSIILSIATPPIPGGALASISVLFTQLGLPAEGLAVVLALNIILDFIETPTDNLGGHAMTILAARKAGMINQDRLRQ